MRTMAENPGTFNKEASSVFQSMSQDERENLKAQVPEPSPMSKGEVKKKVNAIFININNMVGSFL